MLVITGPSGKVGHEVVYLLRGTLPPDAWRWRE
jgi:hypothetical protein